MSSSHAAGASHLSIQKTSSSMVHVGQVPARQLLGQVLGLLEGGSGWESTWGKAGSAGFIRYSVPSLWAAAVAQYFQKAFL